MKETLINQFYEIFGREGAPVRVFFAPGRVNLIGEHTDYNGGFVLPAATAMGTWLVLRPTDDGKISLAVTDLPDRPVLSIDALSSYKDLKWGNYQAGAACVLQNGGYFIQPCQVLVYNDLPIGCPFVCKCFHLFLTL